MLRRILAAAAAALLLPAGSAARVLEAPPASTLAHALRDRALAPAQTAALATTLDGRTVFAKLAWKPLRPASTEKLAVALAALDRLGPGFRIPTLVLGEGAQDGAVWKGDVVLKGFGDPSVHRDDLTRLARAVRERGIRRITGRVLGDESYFDRLRVGPGWKPSFAKLECPPLSALVVDRAWLDGRMRDQPAQAAAVLFTRALRGAGVRVSGRAATGTARPGAPELARTVSPPLRRLIAVMDTESDNFIAEMLLKQLGARERGRGATGAGAAVVRQELAQRGVPLAGVVIADGSGLSLRDRLTARALVAILRSARADPALAASFVDSLALAGKTGTLAERLRSGPAHGVVRAKTGTTSLASALAGYVNGRYAFAVLVNGHPVAVDRARRAQDRFVQLLAAS